MTACVSADRAAHHCQYLCRRLLRHMLLRSERRCAGWYCLCTQVMAMTNLVAAYQANDIREFEKILQQNKWVKRGRNGRGWGHKGQRGPRLTSIVWQPLRSSTGCCLHGRAESGDRCLRALLLAAHWPGCVWCQQCRSP